MTRANLRLGDEATTLREDETGLEVESPVRLAPGRWIELRDDQSCRRAFVWSWRVVRVGSNGLQYRGLCLWSESGGEAATRSVMTETD